MVDRYTRVVLTVIAGCLLYLCLVLSPIATPLRAQQAPKQAGAERPGVLTAPAEVVIVGWRGDALETPLPVVVRNTVTTQAAADGATRVVIAGWEDAKRGTVRIGETGFPVDATRPVRVVLAGSDPPEAAWRQRIPVELPPARR